MPESREIANETAAGPYFRLSLAYVGVFGHLGIVMPAFALWLDDRGYGMTAIGVLLALPAISKMLTPWTWGRWADRSGSTTIWISRAAILATAALICFPFERSLPILFLLMAVYGFCRAPVLPLLEATALRWSAAGRLRYGSVRLWGSLAFAAGSLMFGFLWSRGIRNAGLWLAAASLVICAFAARRLPAIESSRERGRQAPLAKGWPRGSRNAFFVACALMQASHAAYYGFYSLHLTRLGFDGTAVGTLWALAILAEVAILIRLDRWVDRVGSLTMMRMALGVATVRWIWIGVAVHWWEFAAAQLLHGVTYAVFHLAAIRHVDRGFGEAHRTRAQALYSGASFGLGLSVGSLLVGWAAARWGLPMVFRVSAVVALAAIPLVGLSRGPVHDDVSG